MPLSGPTFSHFQAIDKQSGLFWCWFLGRWACVHSETLWVSPINSPVRLGVFSATTTSIGFYIQRFWGFSFPVLDPWVVLSLWLPSCSSQLICIWMWDSLVHQPSCALSALAACLHPLPVWMNVSSLTPWLLDSIQFLFSGYFLFLNLLLSFFWLYKEAKHIYLWLHLGWKYKYNFSYDFF